MQLCSGLISKFFYHSQLAGNGGSLSSVYLISLYPVMEAVVNAMSRRFRSIYCMTYLLLVLKAIVFSGGVEASTFPFQKFTCLFKTIFLCSTRHFSEMSEQEYEAMVELAAKHMTLTDCPAQEIVQLQV